MRKTTVLLLLLGALLGAEVGAGPADDWPAEMLPAPPSEPAKIETGKPKTEKPKLLPKVNIDKADIKTQELILQALDLIGVTYRFGGKSPDTGLDCSGLVRYVFNQSLQMALPHNALAISRLGENVDKKALQPGDLVFFNTLRKKFSHVGIYVGDDRFIHAPSSGGEVRISTLQNKYWKDRFNGARRIAKAGKIKDKAQD